MENHTAKYFVLQLGSLVSLYLSLIFLLVLLFGLISICFPDATDSVWEAESAGGMVRIGIAMVVVFFPTYLVLTRLVNKQRRQVPDGSYLGLTKWLIYLSLLVGGMVLLADLATAIVTFLEGEITTRFVLKVLSVLIIVGTAFVYYIKDARGYWIENEKYSIRFGVFASVLVLAILIGGFTSIDTPGSVREQKLDQTQVTNLQDIQWRISDYLAMNDELPESLEVAYDGLSIPVSPEDRPTYRYEQTESGFKLCATFAEASKYVDQYYSRPHFVEDTSVIINSNDWEYGAGEWCFERKVSRVIKAE